MPDEFRQCVSLKDYKIIAADYSQMELRILAELSQDPAFVNAFHTGHDLHTSTAAQMFNIPIESVTKDQRFVAKTINFGLAYGMGANKLMDILNYGKPSSEQLSYSKVRDLFSKYRKTYHKNTQWLQEAGKRAYRIGYSETLGGRKRFYIRPADDLDESERDRQIAHIKRQGANSPIQGTNADITKLAMNNLHKDLEDYGYPAKIILQVHDEIVVLAHKRAAEPVKEMMKESMLKSAETYIKSVPVMVDAYISDVWKKG
jgi:DNA polymerase-1